MNRPKAAVQPPAATPAPAAPRELVERVGLAVRRLGAQSVIMSQAVADRFSLHTTDLECLDLIYLRDQTSPGDLAKATGLTTGAVTAVIDRLERAGYVERVAVPDDRRRSLIRIRAASIDAIRAVYQPVRAEMFSLWSGFDSGELQVIEDFLTRSADLTATCVDRLRNEVPPGSSKRRLPRGGRRQTTGKNPQEQE